MLGRARHTSARTTGSKSRRLSRRIQNLSGCVGVTNNCLISISFLVISGIKEMSAEEDVFSRLNPSWKLWLEYDDEYVFGPGAYAILKSIQEKGTITAGAKALGMSYRYAWGVVRKIEQTLGVKLLETFKGGTEGGGGARITDFGTRLMALFASFQESFEQVSRKERRRRS
jgi:molybdate transport system regulatory protein